jgi:hypothetical protein
MVTIHSLEVRFDVEGEGDEAVFARMFELHIARWQRSQAETARRERRVQAEGRIAPESGGCGS